MVDVFISYRRAQRSKVEPIKNRLEALGLQVFFDIHGIDGGANFPTLIDTNLRAAKAVLACWSPLYLNQRAHPDWCMIECRFGMKRNVLVPVAIERFSDVEPPADMHTINYFDLTAWRGQDEHEDWQRTLRSLSRHVGRELVGAAPVAPQRQTQASPAPARPAPTPPKRVPIPVPEMVRIPPGRFLMGSPPNERYRRDTEGPQHEVQINYDFDLGKYPVTFTEWDAALAAGAKLHIPEDSGWGRDRRPVIHVSWQDAHAYIAWLNSKTAGGYRLPSEAEWEYACRAGTTTAYSTGNAITEKQARFNSKSTAPVGSFPANTFGLHDMHGNVDEWVEDAWHVWHDNYNGSPNDGSVWSEGDASTRVLLGGSWKGNPQGLRSALRYWGDPSVRSGNYIGFRVARTL